MKRLMCILLAMVLICPVALAKRTRCDGYIYTVNEDGTATIVDTLDDIAAELVIPEELDGYPVTAIGDMAFDDCHQLTSIVIPGHVASIGCEAFKGCYDLASVTLHEGVTSIGAQAFAYCDITEIALPDSLISMGANPFACSDVATVSVSPGHPVFEARDGALFDKTTGTLIAYLSSEATSYLIPEGTAHIGALAFRGCEYLASVTIPDGVTTIAKDSKAAEYAEYKGISYTFLDD